MPLTPRIIAALLLTTLVLRTEPATAAADCITHQRLTQQIQVLAAKNGYGTPEFRIKRNPDGQALVYWHYGEITGLFYAVTFRANECAILTDAGKPRRFVFPKSAYNSGVFFELDLLKVPT